MADRVGRCPVCGRVVLVYVDDEKVARWGWHRDAWCVRSGAPVEGEELVTVPEGCPCEGEGGGRPGEIGGGDGA